MSTPTPREPPVALEAHKGLLTIRGLAEIPYLRTRIIAGAAGSERVVAWAHSSEVGHPWEWFEAGDLLMTLGLGIPADPAAQSTYVERLAETGVCGIAFDEGAIPKITPALLETAERLELPILCVPWDVPFAQLSRAVAAANYGPQLGQLVKTARVYDMLRTSVSAGWKPADLFKQLSIETRCQIFVCMNDQGQAAFGHDGSPPVEVRATFLAEVEKHEKLPGFLRAAVGDSTLLILPIPTVRPASLLAVPEAEAPAFAILQHISTVAALELERMWLHREELRRLGSETLAQLLEGRLIQGTTTALERLGVVGQPFLVLALRHAEPGCLGDLHNVLADFDVPNLMTQVGDLLYVLIPENAETIAKLGDMVPAETSLGVSTPFSDPTKAPTAAQQAKWALRNSIEGQLTTQHGENTSLLDPRSREEAQMVVDQILRPVILYDADHETELVRSLQVFLDSNRSWKQSSEVLHVHKQTLMYRMRRVEELTGLKLNDTSGVVTLWQGLRAHQLLQ